MGRREAASGESPVARAGSEEFGEPDEDQRTGAAGTRAFLVRSLFGLLYAALFIACIWIGQVAVALLVALMSWLCCFEFYRLMRLDGKVPNDLLGLLAAALFPLSALISGIWLTVLLFLLVLALGIWYVWTPRTRLADVATTLFGPIYTGFMLSPIVLLRGAQGGWQGALLTLGVVASLWASDALAYMVGKKLGKHKLVPKISPHKTWAGLFGGLAGSMGVWAILWASQCAPLPLPLALVAGVVVSLSGVVGDLLESRIKRGVGVKDSGHLIPGHGGMLDRTDSLITGCITAYLILAIGGVI